MLIHEYDNWTNFSWDFDVLAYKLADIRHRQGLLLGKMEGLGFGLRQEASLKILTDDVVKSSAIEGENLNNEEVRSSIARRLGMDVASLVPASRYVDGVVEMMLDATQQFDKPLTKDRLFGWHSALFPTGRSGLNKITVGAWRTSETEPMQVVSGAIGREKMHFQAPHADRLDNEMSNFLKWFDNQDTTDPVLRAGLAHLWFVTIHPFEDGNGRIARAIGDMALARADRSSDRFYSLSAQIEKDRNEYYDQLERQQKGTPDVTNWLEWFLGCLGRALNTAETSHASVLFKAKFFLKINQQPVNDRQRLIINRMLEEDFQGHMNTSKYAKMTKCSTDTALRDIKELQSRKILIQNQGGGRSTSYRLADE